MFRPLQLEPRFFQRPSTSACVSSASDLLELSRSEYPLSLPAGLLQSAYHRQAANDAPS